MMAEIHDALEDAIREAFAAQGVCPEITHDDDSDLGMDAEGTRFIKVDWTACGKARQLLVILESDGRIEVYQPYAVFLASSHGVECPRVECNIFEPDSIPSINRFFDKCIKASHDEN